MNALEFRRWRESYGLTQLDASKRIGVSRSTIQNWETGATALPYMIEDVCAIWTDRLKKEQADLGPVTLCYTDGPLWVDAFRPRNKLATMQTEPFATNSAAIARVRKIFGREDVHGPFIMEKTGGALWNQVELARVVDGSDKGAPTVRNTIRRLAEYILENKTAYVRGDPALKKVNDTESEIPKVGEELLRLADEGQNRFVPYAEFEVLLKRLHDLGTYPTNRQVSDVAHAIHGEEITGLWQASEP